MANDNHDVQFNPNYTYAFDPMEYYYAQMKQEMAGGIDQYIFRESKGELGFKIVRIHHEIGGITHIHFGYAVLWIPKGVRIGHYTNSSGFKKSIKKRSEMALVLDIIDIKHDCLAESVSSGTSPFSNFYGKEDFTYTVGEIVEPDSFSPIGDECSNGIHYFGTPKEAKRFVEWEFNKQLQIPGKHILDHLGKYYEMIINFHKKNPASFEPEDDHAAMEELVKFEKVFYENTNDDFVHNYVQEIDADGQSYYAPMWGSKKND